MWFPEVSFDYATSFVQVLKISYRPKYINREEEILVLEMKIDKDSSTKITAIL